MSIKRVLCTGGAGFIGTYVCNRLRELEIRPYVYDINADITQDITNKPQLDYAFDAWQPDAVIHLAGMLGTHELWEDRDAAIDVNIKGALNVADNAIRHGIKMVSIEQPHNWFNMYEATKFAARRMLTGLHYDEGLNVEFVTAHNAYGPGQAHGDGHPQKIIPTFAHYAWRNEPIPVWGDGKQKVNLVWVGDVAESLVDRVLADTQQPLKAFNAGIDRLFTVRTVAAMVAEYTGSMAGIDTLPMRKGEQDVPYPEPHDLYPYKFSMQKLHATLDSYRPEEK